jgi:cyclopropane fatty-acyl-phospholipid synthase-like methyltransferase
MLALVRTRHPEAHGIGIDSSIPMLERGRRRFRKDALIDLRPGDLVARLVPEGPFDAVVSALAIHHLEHERKRTLFGEVHDLLCPTGVFGNLDLVMSPSAELHEHFRAAIGRVKDDPTDRLAGLCEQLNWLRDAGFHDVGCHFKWLELTRFIATRPAAS